MKILRVDLSNFNKIYILLLFCVTHISVAQETEKRYLDTSFWTIWNVDYQLNNGDSVFFEGNTRSSNFDSYIVDGLKMNRAHVMLGYAHKLTPKLYIGASIRSVFEPNWNVWYYRGFLQHNGQIGGLLDFQKRLQYEYISPNEIEDKPGDRSDFGRFGFWAMLGKSFPIGNAKFRGEFSYEIFVHTNDESTEERLVDLSRLRFDFYYLLNENIRIGAFAMRDTQFFFAPATLPSYDEDGNIVQPAKPERNLNLITPVYGLTFKYSFRTKEDCNCPGEGREKRRKKLMKK
ncbi:DUF2490 domain-containing protein [Flammeovirga yaeyamensis]|uniref:DUF2490 domain-containing protein n=1 Tax=Flammeovirga yaeyamensis TaxID=367791 RepID=UPI00146BAF69|nr:DUF2490 domain-containing protein [Flammeovirga yaeyamensis]MBB3696076.1 hypothetical protein [Flammeovirga yaeyamensis]NMF34761.1 DUF2490 domain-containing protein [Flammeovirga yaeyamensis]